MLENLKPGQTIRVTITAAPRRERDVDTLERLMRFNPDAKRTLKHAQRRRDQTLLVRGRGGRPWVSRVKASQVVRAELGAAWSMPYFPHIAPDLRAVERLVKVSPA